LLLLAVSSTTRTCDRLCDSSSFLLPSDRSCSGVEHVPCALRISAGSRALSPWISAREPAFGVTRRDTVRRLIGATALTPKRTFGRLRRTAPGQRARASSTPRFLRSCAARGHSTTRVLWRGSAGHRVARLGRRPLGESRHPGRSGVTSSLSDAPDNASGAPRRRSPPELECMAANYGGVILREPSAGPPASDKGGNIVQVGPAPSRPVARPPRQVANPQKRLVRPGRCEATASEALTTTLITTRADTRRYCAVRWGTQHQIPNSESCACDTQRQTAEALALTFDQRVDTGSRLCSTVVRV
jgi:hypothetical protein